MLQFLKAFPTGEGGPLAVERVSKASNNDIPKMSIEETENLRCSFCLQM